MGSRVRTRKVNVIPAFMSTAIPILIFILILGIVVFTHELGHFIMARRAGVFVEEFALGMGPLIFGFRGKPRKPKSTEEGNLIWHPGPDETPAEESTLFSLRLFPIGGFCKMRGTDESLPDDPGALSNKKVYQRVLVMAGGSLFNFIAAFVGEGCGPNARQTETYTIFVRSGTGLRHHAQTKREVNQS